MWTPIKNLVKVRLVVSDIKRADAQKQPPHYAFISCYLCKDRIIKPQSYIYMALDNPLCIDHTADADNGKFPTFNCCCD
jgi:hypothetical protein